MAKVGAGWSGGGSDETLPWRRLLEVTVTSDCHRAPEVTFTSDCHRAPQQDPHLPPLRGGPLLSRGKRERDRERSLNVDTAWPRPRSIASLVKRPQLLQVEV